MHYRGLCLKCLFSKGAPNVSMFALLSLFPILNEATKGVPPDFYFTILEGII